ncbi:MAG: hypothetical protein WC824_12705 [Bacteroidota bacterium]|jgi:hypothetical protein
MTITTRFDVGQKGTWKDGELVKKLEITSLILQTQVWLNDPLEQKIQVTYQGTWEDKRGYFFSLKFDEGDPRFTPDGIRS